MGVINMFEFLSWKEKEKCRWKCKDKCKKQCVCDVCPPPTQPNEPRECEQRRQQISGDVFVADNGFEFGFLNVLADYPTTIDNSNPTSCEGFLVVVGTWHHMRSCLSSVMILENILE
jgi:hypothetical protein